MPHVATTKEIAKGASKHEKINAKQAVRIASDYFRELFTDAAKANMMLEEIEASSDGRYWLVTLGYDTSGPHRVFEIGVFRSYKTFRIDANTGSVLSVKIHKAT